MDALLENRDLPSVLSFAECQNADTRQQPHLPSVRVETHGKNLTLGKKLVCRVLTLGKQTHTANVPLPSVNTRQIKTHGKHFTLPSVNTRQTYMNAT
jgi:hypothetical protein